MLYDVYDWHTNELLMSRASATGPIKLGDQLDFDLTTYDVAPLHYGRVHWLIMSIDKGDVFVEEAAESAKVLGNYDA